jgi:hypothetical protein
MGVAITLAKSPPREASRVFHNLGVVELACRTPSTLVVRCSAAHDLEAVAAAEPRTTHNAGTILEEMPFERVPDWVIPVVCGSRLAAPNVGELLPMQRAASTSP